MTIIDVNLPSAVSLQWRLYNASGSSISGGSFTATLVDDANADNANVMNSPVTGSFDTNGRLIGADGLGFKLLTNDTSTPAVNYYNFVVIIPDTGRREFRAVLSRTATFTATDLEASVASDLLTVTLVNFVVSPVMIGAAISGPDIFGGSVITAINPALNTVTLSHVATSTLAATSVTIGSLVNVQSLIDSVA